MLSSPSFVGSPLKTPEINKAIKNAVQSYNSKLITGDSDKSESKYRHIYTSESDISTPDIVPDHPNTTKHAQQDINKIIFNRKQKIKQKKAAEVQKRKHEKEVR